MIDIVLRIYGGEKLNPTILQNCHSALLLSLCTSSPKQVDNNPKTDNYFYPNLLARKMESDMKNFQSKFTSLQFRPPWKSS